MPGRGPAIMSRVGKMKKVVNARAGGLTALVGEKFFMWYRVSQSDLVVRGRR